MKPRNGLTQGVRHLSEGCLTPPVRIVEVGPRDGLQHEPTILPTERKVAWINALSRTGVAEIEAGSFVSPRAIPQLADSDDVFRKIERRPGVTYSALVPNARGLERALAVDVRKIALFTAASETFTQQNIHATIRESLDRFRPVITSAKQAEHDLRRLNDILELRITERTEQLESSEAQMRAIFRRPFFTRSVMFGPR